MDVQQTKTQLEAFGQKYDYDIGYMVQLLEDSPRAFEAFAAAQAMGRAYHKLPLEAAYVARVTAMKTDDCGPCLNLGLKMGVEEGIDRELLSNTVKAPDKLPAPLKDIHDHTVAALLNEGDDADRMERIRQQYGIEAFAELAVIITGCRIYPTLKRAMGMAAYCEVVQFDF
ncbi:hypothetical protein [Blastopirellula marina]|uniref:Carboxymuconolactone decarboxylase family protein n=1 Tax=Blastopirellula marina TaxID=124 RepID=A0A2S8F6M7_9BACT|nr:hypothetical protein [Blastopirellula marina]PQO27790.1 hypothetical protein C5Y98_27245 [Blastopirellula marina]PTL41530.1 hypothetical protein C5Y97_27260 [Blastopirellula marina]